MSGEIQKSELAIFGQNGGEITMHSSRKTQAPGHILAGVLWTCPGSAAAPTGRRGAIFFRDFALGNRKIFGSRCQKTSKKPASELSAIPRKTREAS